MSYYYLDFASSKIPPHLSFFFEVLKIFLSITHSRWDLSSPIRGPTRIASIALWILNHGASREVPAHLTFKKGIIWVDLT